MDNSLSGITDSEEEELLKRNSDEDRYSDVVSEDDRLLDKTPDPDIAQNVVFNEMAQDDPNESLLRKSTGKEKQSMDAFFSIAGCINILLIGKSGSGKSTVGNIISGGATFKVAPNAKLVTTDCQEVKICIDNASMNIVDTPGLFNLEKDNIVDAMIGEYLKTNMHLFPLIFVLCIQDGVRFTKEDESVLNRIKGNFGTHVLQNLIVVFTGTMPTVDMPEVLKQFLKDINNMTFHFPNDSRAPERDFERASFVETCQKLLKKPENLNYNLSDYEAAQRHIEERDGRKFRTLQPIQNNPKSSSLIRDKKRKKKCRSVQTSRKT